MKKTTRFQTRTDCSHDYSLPIMYPYCSTVTTINRLMTEPACKNFEDYALFWKEPGVEGVYCEVDIQEDKVELCETIFRKDGSKYLGAVKHVFITEEI
jgi:hypothetical protein